jgi:diguanylate cyclase (GGDEF)-like protein/putative nucleotidyltransferase with HDIG domain
MEAPALSEPRASSAPPTTNPPETERVHRLGVVTTNARTTETLRCALENAGHEVVTLDAGDALFGAIQAQAPDLLLLDADLDTTSPFELCGELRATKAGRFLPIVLVTMERAPESLVAAGLLAGADDFCAPIDRPTEFLARIGVQLRQKRFRDRLRRVRHERDHYRRASKVDPLTGLLNRGSFDSALGETMTGDAGFAILFVDIDHFKSINDNYGHETGDEALRKVARCIERSARGQDRCGRYGGEEFVVLVAGADQQIALAVAERHRRNIEMLEIPGLPRAITASVGVAVFDTQRPDLSRQALYRRADAALYRAKEQGRNRVVLAPGPGERLRVVEPPADARISDPGPPPAARGAELAVKPPRASERAALPPAPSRSSDRIPAAPGTARSAEPPKSRTTDPALKGPRSERSSKGPTSDRAPRADDLEARLLRAMSHRAGLPLLPEAAASALELARDPRSDMPRIAKLVDRDPTLAARFIALANSPLYSYGSRVVSTHAALVRLGLATSRDLLLQVVYERSKGGLKQFQPEVEQSFKRSVIAALAAVDVARCLNVLFEDAYLCGLLHDIGEGRIYRVLGELEGPKPPEAVRALVDKHHARAGAEVARTWGLPQAVVEACDMHHQPPGAVPERVKIIMIADTIAEAAMAPPLAPPVRPARPASVPGMRAVPARVSTVPPPPRGFSAEQTARLAELGFDPKLGTVVLQGVSVAGRMIR